MYVRRLLPADLRSFRAVRLAALLDEPTAFGASYDEEAALADEVIAGRLEQRPDRGVFGAFEGENLVGIVTLARETMLKLRHKGMIFGMYVAPAARGKGVGRALLANALEFAQAVPGLLQVNLAVNAGNRAAIALYESMGFETYGREPGAMLIDGVLHDELHMFWRPPPSQR